MALVSCITSSGCNYIQYLVNDSAVAQLYPSSTSTTSFPIFVTKGDIVKARINKSYTFNAKGCIIYPYKEQNTYSTDETIIGTWIDGRNVYRFTVNVTTGSAVNTNNQMLNLNNYNIDILLSINGYYKTSTGAKLLPNFTSSSGSSISTWINNQGYLTELHTNSSLNSSSGILTLEYIKSE